MKQKGIVIGIAVLEFFAGISAMGAADPAPRFPDRGSWGLNIHHPYSERVIDECGVQWVRVQDRWSRSEPEKGKYDFSVARKLVEFYRSQNCNIIFLLDSETMSPAYENASTEEIIEGMSDWHAATAAEFKGADDIIWEIGNEPQAFPLGNRWNDPKIYTRLARASARKIKAGDPNALVAAGAIAWMDRHFVDVAFRAGLLDDRTIDYITFHGYHRNTMQAESGLAADLEWLRTMLDIFSPEGHFVDIIDSERGLGILPPGKKKDSGGWRNYAQNESEQAAYLARHFLEEIYLGIEVSIWYKDLKGENSYSLYYENDDSGLRPMGKAYRNLSHLLPQNPRTIRNREFLVTFASFPASLPPEQRPFVRSYHLRRENGDALVVASWFPVEVFEGKTIQSRHADVAGNVLEDVWREVNENDVVTIPVVIQVDLAGREVERVSRLELLADRPNTLREETFSLNAGKLFVRNDNLAPMPTIWVIDLKE